MTEIWMVYDWADDDVISAHSSREIADQAINVYAAALCERHPGRHMDSAKERFTVRGPFTLNKLDMP